MENFFNLIDFYNVYKNAKDDSVKALDRIFNVGMQKIKKRIQFVKNLEHIKAFIIKDSKTKLKNLIKETNLSEENIIFCLSILPVLSPGAINYNQICCEKQKEFFDTQKKMISINSLVADGFTDSQIAKKNKTTVEKIYTAKKQLPANIKIDTDNIRKQKKIIDFFELYPFSTAREAAQALVTSVREIKLIAETLQKQGVVLKINNVPRPMEIEEIKMQVVELKKNDPGMTNKEISLKLGISIHQVQVAINEAIRIWQIEKAESYDFYFDKTLTELSTVKSEAKKRHDESPTSSSRWLEIFLMATEKQISMLGLNAPEKININQKIHLSKTEKDKLVQIYMESEAIDADFELIEVTTEQL